MKLCVECKTILEDTASVCTECGSREFTPFETKHCAFCNAEIANGTVICPHCHRIQPPDKLKYSEEQKAERVALYKAKSEEIAPKILTQPQSVGGASTSYMEEKTSAKSVLFDKKDEDDEPFVYRSPFEKIKDEPKVEKKPEPKKVAPKKEDKSTVVIPKEIKSDGAPTVIYNNYYTLPANMKSGSVKITVSSDGNEEGEIEKVNGAPKIESLFDDVTAEKRGDSYVINMQGKVKTHKISVEKEPKPEKPPKAPKPPKQPKVKPPKPVYGMSKVSEVISLIALAIVTTAFMSFAILPLIDSSVMSVYAIPAALSKLNLPSWLGITSNFNEYAELTMIAGKALETYNLIPYLTMALTVASVAAFILVFTYIDFKPGKKGVGVGLLSVATVAAIAMAYVIYTTFNYNFDRVGIGLLLCAGSNLVAIILILAGYKGKRLTEEEIAEKNAKEEAEKKAKEEKRIAEIAKRQQELEQKEKQKAEKARVAAEKNAAAIEEKARIKAEKEKAKADEQEAKMLAMQDEEVKAELDKLAVVLAADEIVEEVAEAVVENDQAEIEASEQEIEAEIADGTEEIIEEQLSEEVEDPIVEEEPAEQPVEEVIEEELAPVEKVEEQPIEAPAEEVIAADEIAEAPEQAIEGILEVAEESGEPKTEITDGE